MVVPYAASVGLSSSRTARSAAAMALSSPLPDPEDKPDKSKRGGPFMLPFVVALLESGIVGRSASDGLGPRSAQDTIVGENLLATSQ